MRKKLMYEALMKFMNEVHNEMNDLPKGHEDTDSVKMLCGVIIIASHTLHGNKEEAKKALHRLASSFT